MNISAIRHNPRDGCSSESDSEDEERSPWPEYEIEHSGPLPTSYTRSSPSDYQHYEWINRGGVSRVYREIPEGERQRMNMFGRDPKSAFADFPEPPEDLSSGDDDFPSHLYKTESRQQSPSAPCSESRSSASNHHTAPSSPSNSMFPLRSVPDSFYQQSGRPIPVIQSSQSASSYDHDHDRFGPSESHWQESQSYDDPPSRSPSAHPTVAASASEEENAPSYRNARRRGKQLFYENEENDHDYESVARQFLSPSAAPSPRPVEHPRDMSVKAKGKQKLQEDVDDANIPNAQMSDLRLYGGVDRSHKFSSTSQGAASEAGKEHGRSRSSTIPAYENSDTNLHDHPSARPRSSSSQSLSYRRGAASGASAEHTSTQRHSTSRIGKRPVNSDSEERELEARDESAEPQPAATGKPPSGKKRKVNRYPCPVPWCKETFTRRNDVRRHVKNAAVHRDSPEALALLGEANDPGTRCKFCNADLSRADARMRHERASACGKRTTQKMKDQMLLMRA